MGGRLYLVRHGRTRLNAAGELRGRLDPALDEVGRQEAALVAGVLSERGVERIVTSPLRRAVETAQVIAARIGADVETDDRLIDRDYGQWAGKTKESIELQWGTVDDAPGVEPAAEVESRVRGALVDLTRWATGAAIVAVSHDIVIRTALTVADPALAPDRLAQETGCINTLMLIDGRWTVESINELPVSR